MNKKRFAIKFAELKDQTTYNKINRVFGYLCDFDIQEFSEDYFTSTKAKLIYDWSLTILESDITNKEKKEILKNAVEDLLSEESDKRDLKNILDGLEDEEENKEKIVIKEVVKYVEKEPDFEIETVLESFLPITFFDDENYVAPNCSESWSLFWCSASAGHYWFRR